MTYILEKTTPGFSLDKFTVDLLEQLDKTTANVKNKEKSAAFVLDFPTHKMFLDLLFCQNCTKILFRDDFSCFVPCIFLTFTIIKFSVYGQEFTYSNESVFVCNFLEINSLYWRATSRSQYLAFSRLDFL